MGRVRGNNEDSFGHAWLDDGSLFVIVADGMGGHEAGEVASGLAVRVLEEAVTRDVSKDPRERLYHGLLEVNDAILDEGRRSGTRGMGTTAVTGIFNGDQVHVALIGDSRMYHIRKGQLVWRTLDHTRVQMLIDRGEITEEEGRVHRESGMLTRALGHSRMADGRPLVPDVLADPVSIQPKDVLVFCSDGLHDLVDDWELAKMVAGLDPDEATERLIALANERGGHDNITVAVIVAGDRSDSFDPEYVPETYEVAPPTSSEARAATIPNPVGAGGVAAAALDGDDASASEEGAVPALEGGPKGIERWMIIALIAVALTFMFGAIVVGGIVGYFLLPMLNG